MLANYLDGLFGAPVRKKVYSALGLVGFLTSGAGVVATALGADIPPLIIGIGAGITFLTSAGNGLAAANTAAPAGNGWAEGYGPTPATDEPDSEVAPISDDEPETIEETDRVNPADLPEGEPDTTPVPDDYEPRH